MKNQKLPTASKLTIVRQLCNYIPIHLVPKLARETGVDEQARTYDEWSHIVTLCYAQVTHSIGLNDVCDALQLNSGPLSAIRGARAPTRNNLSHANKVRDPIMAQKMFWAVYEHLGNLSPRFVSGKGAKRFARKFKRTIHVVDSTTIQLIASCMDWAKHRRRKAAAKCHLRLDLQSFLPRFAIIDTARQADGKRARELCAGIKEGEIVIFKNAGSQKSYPQILRRITAWVEVDGKERLMTFLTNHLTWSPESVAELYRCRWRIETFFKQIKQTLQLADFLGTSANAVRWQVWTALLVYLLLRYLAFLSNWAHSFSRLFAIVRTCLWRRWDLLKLLARYGTAIGSFRYLGRPEQAFFPGFI